MRAYRGGQRWSDCHFHRLLEYVRQGTPAAGFAVFAANRNIGL